MTENEIGDAIFAAAMKVHSTLGPGLLEGAYELCLAHELGRRGLAIAKQVSIPIRYEGLVIEKRISDRSIGGRSGRRGA